MDGVKIISSWVKIMSYVEFMSRSPAMQLCNDSEAYLNCFKYKTNIKSMSVIIKKHLYKLLLLPYR